MRPRQTRRILTAFGQAFAILTAVLPPIIQPMPLVRQREPFSHPDWLFEIKHDGFRALAYVENGTARLLSRNGNWFKSFPVLCDSLASDLRVRSAVLDGEIVYLDKQGRTQFNRLLYRRGDPRFYAFDLLFLNGRDLRKLPLIERKTRLRKIIPPQPSRLLLCDYIEGRGEELFAAACCS